MAEVWLGGSFAIAFIAACVVVGCALSMGINLKGSETRREAARAALVAAAAIPGAFLWPVTLPLAAILLFRWIITEARS